MTATATENNGFISQRDFRRYMTDYEKNVAVAERFTDSVSRSLMASGREKGEKGEFIVKGILQDLGYEVRYLGGSDSCDLMVKIDGSWKDMEVKTAQYGKKGQYQFSNIKPDLFDMIAFVFVGESGTTVKIGAKGGRNFIRKFGSLVSRVDCQETYYNIALNKYRGHGGLYGTERMLEVNNGKEGAMNMQKLSKDL
jgi:hypothetical protein